MIIAVLETVARPLITSVSHTVNFPTAAAVKGLTSGRSSGFAMLPLLISVFISEPPAYRIGIVSLIVFPFAESVRKSFQLDQEKVTSPTKTL